MNKITTCEMLFFWRWNYGAAYRSVVAELAAKQSLPETKQDPWIEAAVDYCRKHAGLVVNEVSTTPTNCIAAAILINRTARLRDNLKVLVLANMPRQEISELLGVDEPAIEAWEQLFFCCREHLATKGWIVNTPINAVQKSGDLELAAKMRIAFGGGPVVARAIVAGDDFSEKLHRMLRNLKACLKLDEAWDATVRSPKAAVAAMRLHLLTVEEDRKQDRHEKELAAAAERRAHEEAQSQRALERARALEHAAALKLEAAQLTVKNDVSRYASQSAGAVPPMPAAEHRPAA